MKAIAIVGGLILAVASGYISGTALADAKTMPKEPVKVGDTAPDFTLPNQSGSPVRLNDIVGKKVVVLYFYPKDFTSGCTKEACAFRDGFEVFKREGAEVIGVSSDTPDSHGKFAAAYHLPFTLLSDEGGKVRKLYGVPATMGVFPGRVTYIIDTKGVVRYIYNSQFKPTEHVDEALKVLRAINQGKQISSL